jgi:hypothetical protein
MKMDVGYARRRKLMFDVTAREGLPPPRSVTPSMQFISIEVLPTADGLLCVSLTGTSVDEETLEFINDDIESVRVATIEEAVSVIRRSLTDALHAHMRKEH